jgi:hypothetical protein
MTVSSSLTMTFWFPRTVRACLILFLDDHFGAASETSFSQAPIHERITQEELGPINWEHPYFNAGMMIFSRTHKNVFDPSYPKLVQWASEEVRQRYNLIGSDQPYFNYRVNELKVPFVDVGFRYNHTRAIPETQYRFRSHFIHHSGPSGHRYGTKLHQLGKDAGILGNPFLLSLSQRIPVYRWIADRLDWGFVEYLCTKSLPRESNDSPPPRRMA